MGRDSENENKNDGVFFKNLKLFLMIKGTEQFLEEEREGGSQKPNRGLFSKIIIGLLVFAFLGLVFHAVFSKLNSQKEQEVVDKNKTETTQQENKTETPSTELPQGEESIKTPSTNSLSDINNKVKENEQKKLEELQAKAKEYDDFVANYVAKINGDEDIIPLISSTSLKKIEEINKKRFASFSEEEKGLFMKDLKDLGWEGDFNPNKKEDLDKYVNFLVKGGFKVNGKIVEIADVAGRFDEKLNSYCGSATFVFDGKAVKKKVELCLDSEKKMVIHSY